MSKLTTRVFAVDPAVRDLGWAFVDYNPSKARPLKHVASGVLSQSLGKLRTLEAIDNAVEEMRKQLLLYNPDRMVIEEPQIFASGVGLAALHSGAVLKLTAVVYAVRQMMIEVTSPHNRPKPHLAKVSIWKGNQPKVVTQRRVIRDLGVNFEDHNQMDAIGLARWYCLNKLKGNSLSAE